MYELVMANKNYSSWSLRPWLLMRVKEIAFKERLVPFPGGDSYATYRPHTPSGRVPCLIDGGKPVWDSLAIVEYLAERHPGVWPANADARAWARCASAEMHSSFDTLRSVCPMNCGVRVRLGERPPMLERDLARIAELWNEGLSGFGGPYLGGAEFTAVDAFFAPVVFRAQSFGLIFGGQADAYGQRMLALPAMQEWYRAALQEPWREPGHEAEVTQFGEITADERAGGRT